MSARPFCRLICALMAACLMLCACAQGAAGAATAEQAATATPAPTSKPKVTAHNTAHTAATGETADSVPTVLPESKDAGRSYLDGTLFIGDSNTARYMMYADDTGKAFTTVDNTIGVVSMSATAITTLKCERFKGYNGAYTIPDAVAMLKPQRIIIGFGTNDLCNYSTANYIEKYGKGLAAIAAAWEYADIIVCAVPPLDYQRENTRLTMKQVDDFNTALTALCEEEGYHFLNTAEVLKDASSGWAKKDYTLSDGVHLSKTAVTALFGYIRTHALTTPDRRPKDLGTIPKPDGVPPGLIQKDPIAVRGAKVPVEFVADKGGTLQGPTSQNVKKGGTCATVTAVPNTGWQFDYWTASIGSTGGGASLTFTVPGDADANGVIITAHFTPAEHDHDYVEIEGTHIAPTCEQDGSADYECSICGQVIEKTLPKLGHDWDGGVVTQAATENTEGLILYTCKRDSTHTATEKIAKLQHQHTYVCVTETKPTCEAAGYRKWQCSCGDSYEEFPAANGHQAVPGQNGGTVCAVCGALLEAPPTQTDSPSNEEQTTPTNPPAHTDHDYSISLNDNTATCEAGGLETWKCSGCEATIQKETGPLGHSWEPQGDGSSKCSRCGVIQPAPQSGNPIQEEDPSTGE